MDQRTFMDLLDVAWDDFRDLDPQAAGIAIIVLKRDEDDELAMQMGANVPTEVVMHALTTLLRTWRKGGPDVVETRFPPNHRKKVV